MSIQTTSKIIALPPELNTFAVIAHSVQDLLQESEKTNQVYADYVKNTQETITTQAQEILKLKAELASEKERYAREIAALRAVHAAEVAKYVSAAQIDQGRITGLANRVDQEAAKVQTHRTLLATAIGHTRPNDVAGRQFYAQAREILK